MATATSPPLAPNGVLASLPPIAPSLAFARGGGGSEAAPPPSAAAPAGAGASPPAAPAAPAAAAAAVPPSVKLGHNRYVLTSRTPRRWAWRPFTSSARRDGVAFHHWVRANVEYADYPYSRFDVSLEPLGE